MSDVFDKPNFGLLMIRVSVGVMFMTLGGQKLMGSVKDLEEIGKAIEVLGVTQYHLFFGIVVSLAEAVGGFLIALGLQFRITATFMMFTMLVGVLYLHNSGADFIRVTRPFELMAVFLGLLFTGPGKYSVDHD